MENSTYSPKVLGLVKIICIADIQLGQRARKDYGNMQDFKLSIAKRGLIHPIAVYSPTGNAPYLLVAGGRRLEACKLLKLQQISARVYDYELTERELKALELFENLDRKELTYAEKIDLEQEFHDTLVQIEGPKIDKTNNIGHSLTDTAKMLKKDVSSLSKDFQLGKIIREHPELGLDKLKNKTQAYQVLKRLGAALSNKVNIQAKVHTASSVEQQLLDSYKVGDFFENALEDRQFNFIECDPPYGIDLIHMRSASDKEILASQYKEIPASEYLNFSLDLARETYRLASPDAYIVWWCAHSWCSIVFQAMKYAGWEPCSVPGFWIKGIDPGQSHNPQLYLGNSCEVFIYARKGNAQLKLQGRSNVFNYSPTSPAHKIRIGIPERPKDLIRDLLNTFCWPNSHILVPFAGSGRTLIESYKLGFPAIGFDLSKEFYEAFSSRVLSGEESGVS